MPGTEFVEWMEFEKLEPFGERRADLRSALICKVLADINTAPGRKKARLTDFLLDFEREAVTPEQMLQQAELANLALGGADTRTEVDS